MCVHLVFPLSDLLCSLKLICSRLLLFPFSDSERKLVCWLSAAGQFLIWYLFTNWLFKWFESLRVNLIQISRVNYADIILPVLPLFTARKIIKLIDKLRKIGHIHSIDQSVCLIDHFINKFSSVSSSKRARQLGKQANPHPQNCCFSCAKDRTISSFENSAADMRIRTSTYACSIDPMKWSGKIRSLNRPCLKQLI